MRSEVIHRVLYSSVLGTAGVHVSQAGLHLSSNAHSITKFIFRSLFLVGTKPSPEELGAIDSEPTMKCPIMVIGKPKTSQHTSELLPLCILLWNRVSVFFIFFPLHQISSVEEGILHTNIIKALHITFTGN